MKQDRIIFLIIFVFIAVCAIFLQRHITIVKIEREYCKNACVNSKVVFYDEVECDCSDGTIYLR